MGSSISLNKEQIMARKKQLQVFPTVKRPTKVQIEKMLQSFMNTTACRGATLDARRHALQTGKTFAILMHSMKAMDTECFAYYVGTLQRNFDLTNEAVSHA
jgi:hypothetical protein